jgi:hypothetical protein
MQDRRLFVLGDRVLAEDLGGGGGEFVEIEVAEALDFSEAFGRRGSSGPGDGEFRRRGGDLSEALWCNR